MIKLYFFCSTTDEYIGKGYQKGQLLGINMYLNPILFNFSQASFLSYLVRVILSYNSNLNMPEWLHYALLISYNLRLLL